MPVKSWQQVKQILAGALELEPHERPAYLVEACSGNADLLQEVQSLLDAHQRGESLLEHSTRLSRALNRGDKLDVYVIEDLIGVGGMGEVYRALDTSLNCRVAIKVLPPVFSADPERLARFEREAQAAAALNHPNILSIHRLGKHEGTLYIVSELLVGKSLRELLKHQQVFLAMVLDYAVQIASGLAAAHGKNIVHRDIKPGNLFVTEHQQIKILDFGLAKAAERTGKAGSAFIDRNADLTEPGRALGTIAYMSPEQARGKEVGPASDIFSFGIVLYEMTTGKRPFTGETSAVISDGILNRDPVPPSHLNPAVTPAFDAIILRALEKDVTRRYQSGSEIRVDLECLEEDTELLRIRKKAGSVVPNLRTGIVAFLTLLAVVVALVGYFVRHGNSRLTEKDTVVLTDFVNSTDDPVFDGTLRQGLSVALNQSPFLNVLSENKVRATFQMMSRPAGTKLTPDVARELCLRAGSKAYIAGSIASLGSQYVLGLQAVNCLSGDILAQEQATAPAKEKVLDALGEVASKLRGELGESLAMVQKFDVPLEQATTSSLEALKAYTLGAKASREKGPGAALPFHQRAIQLDPNFAMGHEAVGVDYFALGELGRASEYDTRAFELRERASERERLNITAQYYSNVTGELDKAAQTYQGWVESYPRDDRAHLDLGNVYSALGWYAKAGEEYGESKRLAPDRVGPYDNLASCLLALQRFDEARHVIRDAQTRKLDDSILHNALYGLAFLGSDSPAMAEQQQWFAGQTDVENAGLALASDTEAYAGHLSKARELTRRSVDSAVRADSKESGAIWQENAALREAAFGNTAEAKQAAMAGLKLAPDSQGVKDQAALAFAMAGDASRGESLAQELNKRFPLDTQMHSLWLSAIRAQLALNRKSPDDAFNALQIAASMELGQIAFLNNVSCLYPAYVRANAYLAAGQGNAAAAEFQKVVDHSGIVWNCWTGALAHLGVARGNALQAKSSHGADADAARVRALAAYREFLTLWKNADPDIPILKQAKAEFAKLQQAGIRYE